AQPARLARRLGWPRPDRNARRRSLRPAGRVARAGRAACSAARVVRMVAAAVRLVAAGAGAGAARGPLRHYLARPGVARPRRQPRCHTRRRPPTIRPSASTSTVPHGGADRWRRARAGFYLTAGAALGLVGSAKHGGLPRAAGAATPPPNSFTAGEESR